MLGLDIVFGAVTGLLGNGITAWTNYKMQKVKNEHDITIIKVETEAMKEEAKANIQIEKARIEGEIELTEASTFLEGIKEGNKQTFSDKWIDKLFDVEGWVKYISIPVAVLIAFLFGIVDFLKALMRPGLTLYLTGCTTWITYLAWNILDKYGTAITSAQALEIFDQVVSIIIYLTVSSVTWWFGDRRTAKFLMRLNDGNKKD